MLRKALALALALLCQLTLLAPQSCAAYTDVPQNAWYHDMVNQMSQTGLLSGYQDGSFRPDNPITAAEFTTVTARAAGLSPGASSGHWAAGIMQAALEKGWYDWDELPPTGEQYDQPIPRQLAAKIAMKALAPDVWGDYNTQSQKIQDFAALEGRYYEPVLAAYQAGVLQGDDDGNFRPKEGLSRAEACAVVLRAANLSGGPKAPAQPEQPAAPVQPVQPCKGGVSENGRLQVIGTQLCNKNGQPVTLRGMSSHGMQWYGQFASAGALASLKEWGANLFRVAMYTGEGGYLSDSSLKEKAFAAVDAAVQQDLYVILDWHILSDGNPMDHAEQAAEFFTEAAQRYRDTPNILYEICNEQRQRELVGPGEALRPASDSGHSGPRPQGRDPCGQPHLESGRASGGPGPAGGRKYHVYPAFLRRNSRPAAAGSNRPSAGLGGADFRLRMGNQPSRRRRRSLFGGIQNLAGFSGSAVRQLVQLVPLRQRRNLCRFESRR